MSDAVERPDQPVITKQQAARAIMNYFLANAEAGNHAANDQLIAELARRRKTGASRAESRAARDLR